MDGWITVKTHLSDLVFVEINQIIYSTRYRSSHRALLVISGAVSAIICASEM